MKHRDVVAALCVLALGYGVARLIDHTLAFRFQPKEALASATVALPNSARRPLELRLVDAGGVGILPDTARWGRDYSHATAAFQHMLLNDAPYVDEDAFRTVRRDWSTFLGRTAAYGSNGVVVPGVLQHLNFDRVGDGFAVYAAHDPGRARRHAWRQRFTELFDLAHAQGFGVYLATDMLALTTPLRRYLIERVGSLDGERAELWETYAAGFDELFAALPRVTGVVIRVGEGGELFNPDGWEYRSEFGVKSIRALRAMLDALLPVFERHGRTLVLRTWSVGSGELGDMHTNPATYEAALGDVDSPSLVVSTKYPRGDFYGFQPANPTLRGGRHRRLVEFQARREYEGFNAFPNYVAPLHRAALLELMRDNPRIVGSWLWTQEGGPLHAGPLSLYPLHGAWGWIDANVHGTAQLARDPGTSTEALARQWGGRAFPADTMAARTVAGILLSSRDVVERGLYIRPFAEQGLWAFRLEVPPMLWILEWDVVGATSAVWSTVYRGVRGRVDTAVADGFSALRDVRAMRASLLRVPRWRDDALLIQMEASLAFQESLFETLAWYRRTMLDYYLWLDTGDPRARARWRESAPQFVRHARDHVARFGDNLDTPAYDFSTAVAGLESADQALRFAWLVRALLAGIAVLLLRPSWARAPALAILATCCVVVFSEAASVRLVVATAFVCAAVSVTIHQVWRSLPPERYAHVARVLNTGALITLAILLAPAALRGPAHFWLLFWSPGVLRILWLTAVVALVTTTLYAVVRAEPRSAGGILLAAGVAGIVISVAMPTLAETLVALERPLALAPMGTSFLHAALDYFDFPRAAPWYPALVGIVLLAAGLQATRKAVGAVTTSESTRPAKAVGTGSPNQ